MSRLHWRIFLHSLAVLLVVGVATSVVFALRASRPVLHDVARRTVRHLATLTAEQASRPEALRARLEQLHADLQVDLTVRDRDGRLLASAGPVLPPLAPGEAARVLGGEVVVAARPTWQAAARLVDPATGAAMGTLRVVARHEHAFAGPGTPLLWVVVVLGVVGLATWPLARRIARPVERLTEAARRLGEGDLAYRVPLEEPRRHRRRRPGTDELAALTQAFNGMADRVERLVRGQRELLANVSHELRSPLSRIRVALALLPRDGAAEARLAAVESDLAELDRLIEAVLTTSRLDATGLPVELARVDVRRVLARVAEEAAGDPATAGLAVRVVEGPPLPVVADEALLRRALRNLVENAAKYGTPPITLAADREGDRVVLSVSDEGEGVPPAERFRVLEPFYRVDRARTPGGTAPGFGLGLTLARRVAEVHGGTITVGPAGITDGREHGCRVALALPAAMSAAP